MTELLQAAFSPVNLMYTLLLILVLIYWLSVIIGAMDFGSLDVDFDLDADLDFDVDADVDVDTDTDMHSSSGGIAAVLHFFNFGKMPFMIVMSFLVLFAWSINVLANFYLGNGSPIFAIAMLIPNLFVSLCLTKIITTPIIPAFKGMDKGAEDIDYIGQVCTLTLPATSSKMGQAEVNYKGSPLLIYVKADPDSNEILKKGEEAVIVQQQKDKSLFIIRRMSNLVH